MRPIGDHLIVTLINEDATITTDSGIVFAVPDTALDKPNRGEVVAVGEGRILPDGTLRPIPLKTGDRILFSRYAGSDFKLDNVIYLVLSFDDILAIL